MFCGECGTKNKKSSIFCEECGARLQQEEQPSIERTPRKPMTKKQKGFLAVIILLVILLGAGFKIGKDLTSPKKIAKDYVASIVSGNWDHLYRQLKIEGDKTFVSKQVFATVMDKHFENLKIANFKMGDVSYGSNRLSARVKVNYTVEGNSSEQIDSIDLVKQKGKQYLFFDRWTVSGYDVDSTILKDYEIQVLKGTKITYGGVEVESKYKQENKSNDLYDVYVLPQVFMNSTLMEFTLPNGLKLQDTAYPSTYKKNYEMSLSEDILSKEDKTKIVDQSKHTLDLLYQKAIYQVPFEDFKSELEHEGIDLTKLGETYQNLVRSLAASSSKLTSIVFTKGEITGVDFDSNGEIKISLKANYSYSITYKGWDDKEQVHTDTDYDYIDIIMTYKDGNYYIVNIDDLITYFSRY